MKLDQILESDPYADDSEYVPSLEHKEQTIRYIWNHILSRYIWTTDGSQEERKCLNQFKKYERLWATVPELACIYAIEIIRERFRLGEPIIATDSACKKRYQNHFLNC